VLPCLISPSNFGCTILNFPSQRLVMFNSFGSRMSEFACNLLTPHMLLFYVDVCVVGFHDRRRGVEMNPPLVTVEVADASNSVTSARLQ